ncbi:hypothetical protein [Rhizobium sullae]|uniref:hypothetical protein n=1 Tax=Rhizobium sullae TaxID=50338 RepID=UPI001FCE05CA|nr:hypothetical protein [Rhizobium sullae]
MHYIFHRSTWSLSDSCYLQDLFVAPVVRGKEPEDFAIGGVTPAPSVYFSDVARQSTANGCSRDSSTRSILEFDR